jgi:hypothetical protein
MACVVTQAWLRSIYHRDSIGFSLHGRKSVVESNSHYLDWSAEVHSSILWRVWHIPYWSLTIPLTLLSAYLILWKPRKRGVS